MLKFRIREYKVSLWKTPRKPEKKTLIQVKAKQFIDCSYEGDLMAKAGVSYFVGREDETLNGVQMSFLGINFRTE